MKGMQVSLDTYICCISLSKGCEWLHLGVLVTPHYTKCECICRPQLQKGVWDSRLRVTLKTMKEKEAVRGPSSPEKRQGISHKNNTQLNILITLGEVGEFKDRFLDISGIKKY